MTSSPSTAQAARTGIVDSHIHLWAADKDRFPFHPGAPYLPDYTSTVEQWLADREGTGIALAIFVQGLPYGEDHRYLLYCLDVAQGALRGVCRLEPDAPGSARRLRELVQDRRIVGVRVHSTGEKPPGWGTRNFEAFWETVGDLDLVLQMHMTPQWSRAL